MVAHNDDYFQYDIWPQDKEKFTPWAERSAIELANKRGLIEETLPTDVTGCKAYKAGVKDGFLDAIRLLRNSGYIE